MLNRILISTFKVLAAVTIAITVMIFSIVIVFWFWIGSVTDAAHRETLAKSEQYDHQAFLSLGKSIFFYSRMHVGDSGNWVVVYSLDWQTRQAFLSKYQEQQHAYHSSRIECIKPTIKKRWRTLRSNIHYVQLSEWAKDHHDYKVHDSFIAYGSEKQIEAVEQACMAGDFKVLFDPDKFPHRYWAISEKQNLLFSVYEIN